VTQILNLISETSCFSAVLAGSRHHKQLTAKPEIKSFQEILNLRGAENKKNLYD